MDRLRLAFLAGPAELLAWNWMSTLADFGHDVRLIVRAEQRDLQPRDPRVRIEPMPPIDGLLGRRLRAPSARSAIRQTISRIAPDVLHVHDLTTGYGWLAWLSAFHPWVATTWGSDVYLTIPRSRTSRLIGRLALRSADLVTMETTDVAAAAVRAGARPERVRVLQFGVDTRVFRPGSPDPALVDRLGLAGYRVLLSPRQIAPLYEHPMVVRALAQLPRDVALVMSAHRSEPAELEAVRSLATSLGVLDRVRIVPTIAHSEMPEYMRLATVVVSVPLSDSISVSVLEAMATGRAVVATDLPSPREWLADVFGDTLVPHGDVEALTTALTAALKRPARETEERAVRARALVSRRAEREANMRLMETHYRRLVEEREDRH